MTSSQGRVGRSSWQLASDNLSGGKKTWSGRRQELKKRGPGTKPGGQDALVRLRLRKIEEGESVLVSTINIGPRVNLQNDWCANIF